MTIQSRIGLPLVSNLFGSRFLGEVTEGGHIAMMAHSGYDGGGNTRNEGFVPEILPCMDIGKVNLDSL